MANEFSFNIDNSIFNIFSAKSMKELKSIYSFDKYYQLNQIHSNIVHIVDDNYLNNSDGDAMITNIKNIPLVIRTADCIPILLYDKKNKVIAAVHSGWKGTLNNIVGNSLKVMMDNFNSKSSDISAYLYPSIRNCHFEVESDVYNQFKDKIPDIDKYVIKKRFKYYINLQEIVKNNIKELGVINIFDSGICTYCHHDIFHSYRYNHDDSRNYLLVMIKESNY